MKTQPSKYGILYVDDEEISLKYFKAAFRDIAPVYTASSAAEGFELFCKYQDEIGLVLSDKRMPEESGLEFLTRVRDKNSEPHRILVTAHADLRVAVEALNDGLISTYLEKPWDPQKLERRLIESLEMFCLKKERDRLVEEKAELFQQLIMADRVASIGIISSGVNHHLRNALTVFQSYIDMIPSHLEEEVPEGAKNTEFWEDYRVEVGSHISRMVSMLSNLSEGGRPTALDLEDEVDVPEIFAHAREAVLEGDCEIVCTTAVHGEIPMLRADRQKIEQMARLLLQNSKSNLSNSSGHIEILIRVERDHENINIFVTDDGALIDATEYDRLFDPFYVRKDRPGSMETNLIACYLTAFQHGGKMCARRTEDGRNEICVVLPVQAKERTAEGSARALQAFKKIACPSQVMNESLLA